MLRKSVAERIVTVAVRAARPRWVRDRLASILDGFERFAPIRRLALPSGSRLTVIAPHPDDESIGCGGLLALWTGVGRTARVVFLTQGEMGSPELRDPSLPSDRRAQLVRELSRTRRDEAEVALGILRASGIWLDGADGALHRDEARLIESLAKLWESDPPDVVAAPDPGDRHPDHAVAARIVGRAAARTLPASTPILAYEVWSPAPVNAVLDITAVADAKREAIAAHRSQTATTDYVAAAAALNRYRAITSGQGEGAAEGFRVYTIRRYAELAEQLRV